MIHPNPPGKSESTPAIEAFDLESFFPYLVRIFYRAVSDSVSQIYAEKFALSVSEWRVLAVLGPHDSLSASQIVEISSLNKVNVSRALKGLQAHGYIRRDIDGGDKRRAVVRLTPHGREVLTTLIPLVKSLEQSLFAGVTEPDLATLHATMEKIRGNAERIIETGEASGA